MGKKWGTQAKMRQNLFSLWASSRLRMKTTEKQIPGAPRAPHTRGRGHSLASAGPTVSTLTVRIRAQELGESGVGGGRKTGSSPDRVLTMFPTSIGRKNSSAI